MASERAALEPELIEARRPLHRQHELAFAEHRTAELVARRLRASASSRAPASADD